MSLKRRPHYGLKLVGKEISIRGCLSELFYTSAGQGIRLFNQVLPEEQDIEACIVEGIHLCGYTIYDSDRSNIRRALGDSKTPMYAIAIATVYITIIQGRI